MCFFIEKASNLPDCICNTMEFPELGLGIRIKKIVFYQTEISDLLSLVHYVSASLNGIAIITINVGLLNVWLFSFLGYNVLLFFIYVPDQLLFSFVP